MEMCTHRNLTRQFMDRTEDAPALCRIAVTDGVRDSEFVRAQGEQLLRCAQHIVQCHRA